MHIYKRNINSEAVETFNQKLYEIEAVETFDQNSMKLTRMKSKVRKIYLNPMKHFELNFSVSMTPFFQRKR